MADAAGLGRITVFSALGQPLRAEIEVNANSDELKGMAAKIASPESFRQAGLEYASALTGVKVSLDKRPTGQPVIRLVSDRPVSDPFIDLLLELNWASGRLVREYTFLLDPPDVAREAAAPTAAEAPVAKAAEKPVAVAPEKKLSDAPVAKADQASAAKEQPKSVKAADKAEDKTAAGEDAPSSERLVKSGDTLSKIARDVKPEGVALDQVLVSLFRANPDAFQGSNMNRLKSGKILAIPGKEAMESVSAPVARKEVIAQAQDWNAYRRKLAGVTAQEPATEKPAQTESAGKITAKVEDKVAKPVDNKDQVKVSKTETPGAQPPAVKKAAAEEEKIAREKALKESAERAAQLEKNVADLQKMAELKNKQLAQAQAAAKPVTPAPAVAPAEPAKPAEAAKPATAAAVPATAVAAVSAVTATSPAEPAKAATAAPEAEKIPTAPKPKPKAPPPPPVEEDEGLGIAVWGGLAALLAAIGGLVFYRRRKAAPTGEVPFVSPSLGEPSLGANSVFRATGGQSIDTSAASPAVTDFSQTGPGTIDTDEVDPVAEAEVYMAYGRDAQAEEILLEALQKDSKRLAIHLKLLEIYSQRKSAKQFETLATELYAQTGGNGPEWDKAVAMGSKLDPANPLYAAGGSAAPSPFAAAPAVAAVAAGFDPDATVVVSSGSKEAPSAPAAVAAPAAMSFDLNIGDLPQFGDAPSFTPGDTQIKGAPKADDLSGGVNGLALDFDLDLGSSNVAPPAVPDQNIDLGASGMDFDLKLGDSQVAPHLGEASGHRTDLSSINLDLGQSGDNGMMDLERTMLAVPGSMDSAATNILGGIGAGAGAGGGNALEQAVATKLDLAKAYEEMGDAEGARDLLQEALAEGTDAQKATASAMLAKLG